MTTKKHSKSLIVILTCNRPRQVMAYLNDYLRFVENTTQYDLVVSIDGFNSATQSFLNDQGVSYIYSAEREGVGISKNRTLTIFPNYDFYFFIEDDTELIDASVFDDHIRILNKNNIHHLSLGERHRFFGNKKEVAAAGSDIFSTNFGSGSFSCFTKQAIDTIGGFHIEFAKYRRFGHTEHSHRIKNASLQEAPFIVSSQHLEGYFKWHCPPSVTDPKNIPTTTEHIALAEDAIMKKRLSFYPIETLSEYAHVRGRGRHKSSALSDLLALYHKYALASESLLSKSLLGKKIIKIKKFFS